MTDEKIIDLFWMRSEAAIEETDRKYGGLCYSVAYRILRDHPDSEECVSDCYLRAWNVIPPQRPQKLSAFLAKIVRNLALNRYEKQSAAKRGGGEAALALDELGECISSGKTPEEQLEEQALPGILNGFLGMLKQSDRMIFLLRYWDLRPVKEIATLCGATESRVKMSLHRSRRKLKDLLEKEGIAV